MRNATLVTEDGSWIDAHSGIPRFLSRERFAEHISSGGYCFLCDAERRHGTEFNDEHIIPRWLLRAHSMFDITISNTAIERQRRYSQYKIPCCKRCNSWLGRNLEQPIRDAFENGHTGVVDFIKNGGSFLLFAWLALIFLKNHIWTVGKSSELDQRGPTTPADHYIDWSAMHHVHCLARSPFMRTRIDFSPGSLLVLPAVVGEQIDQFDFVDFTETQSILLRHKDVCVIAVLDDASGSLSVFQDTPYFQAIGGALSPIQLREVFAHLSYINSALAERPEFWSELQQDGSVVMRARIPSSAHIKDHSWQDLGAFLYSSCHEIVRANELRNTMLTKEEILKDLNAGKRTFLMNEDGTFNSDQ